MPLRGPAAVRYRADRPQDAPIASPSPATLRLDKDQKESLGAARGEPEGHGVHAIDAGRHALRYETYGVWRLSDTRRSATRLSRPGGCSGSARAPVVHGDRDVAERLRRDQLEPSRAGQPALVQGRAVAGDPGVDEELVSSIRSSRSSSVASVPLPRSTPAGVASLSFCTPVRRSPAMWWLLSTGSPFASTTPRTSVWPSA